MICYLAGSSGKIPVAWRSSVEGGIPQWNSFPLSIESYATKLLACSDLLQKMR